MNHPDLFSQHDPLSGSVEIDGRTYSWTLHPGRMAEDGWTRETAPSTWAFTVTSMSYGLKREVRSYKRRDEVWREVRDGMVA